MFNPTRDQARQFMFDTWRKHRSQEPLTGLETILLGVLLWHPEYHTLLDQPERHAGRDYLPEHGETNPFLHLMMHVTIEEQLSIDQPAGIAGLHQRLVQHHQDPHEAQHAMMDCLGEMIWHAQRYATPPNPEIYLACLRGKLGEAEP